MDTITHGLAGALIAKTGFGQRIGNIAIIVLTVSAVFPDSDILVDLIGDEFLYLRYHRSLTHSFLGSVIFSAVIAGVFYWFSSYKKYWILYFLSWIGILSHIFLDLPTAYGTQIFFPFSDRRVAWDMLFIIDLVFTGILIIPQLITWVYKNHETAIYRAGIACFGFYLLSFPTAIFLSRLAHVGFPWKILLVVDFLFIVFISAPGIKGWIYRWNPAIPCRIGLAVLLSYMGLCGINHHLALKKVEDYIQKERLQAFSYAAFPRPFSPFSWSGVIKTQGASYQSWLNVLTSQPIQFSFFQDPPKNNYITIAENLPVVQLFLWFARFPVITYQTLGQTHVIEYLDLRFHTGYRRTPFVLEIIMGPDGKVLEKGFAD
jgi:membrane-bound metal-dependent hydrolase YbcI (DUF457 family)